MDGDGQVDESFEALLRFMRDSRGFDFTGYKRASLMRRVRHRMDAGGHPTFDGYLDTLQASSDEFAALFNTILINVTTFFRDPHAWDYLRTDAIPAIAGRTRATRPDPDLECRLRLRSGALQPGHAAGRGARP